MLYIILLLVGFASQASQVYYNTQTGAYATMPEPQIQPQARPHLFNNKPTTNKTKSSWILPSLSIYGGMSVYQASANSLEYQDSTRKTTTQTIPETDISTGNAVVGAEFLFPISQNMKIGGGASYNPSHKIFNGVISSESDYLLDLALGNAVYGKISYKFGRISAYTIGGVQSSKISFYDSVSKDSLTNPWTYLNPKDPATYNILGTFATKNPFFGFGASYRLSPAFSIFADTTFLSLSNLTGMTESTATVNQITALQNARYTVIQNRFGLSFDFIGLASKTF